MGGEYRSPGLSTLDQTPSSNSPKRKGSEKLRLGLEKVKEGEKGFAHCILVRRWYWRREIC